MTTRFPSNSEIGAGPSPLWTVRRDPTPAGAKLCEEMRQFMTQSAIDFRLAMLAKTAIENDARSTEFSAAGSGTEAA